MRRLRLPVGPLAVLVLLWVVFGVAVPGFIGENTVFSVLQQVSLLGLVAAGVGVTMIAGELDLSVASIAVLGGVVGVSLANVDAIGVWWAIVLSTVVAAAFGAAQGAAIAALRINSVVFTVGTLFALLGVATMLTGGRAVLLDLELLDASDLIIHRLWVFSPLSLCALLVLAAVGAWLAVSRWGREIYAIGGARRESAAAGVSQRRPVVLAFALSAGLSGLAGASTAIVGGSGSSQAFSSLLLLSITAVLVGGVGAYGGSGTMLNVVVGALIMQTLATGLTALGAPATVQELATGLLLLAVIIFAVDWRKLLARSRFSTSQSKPAELQTSEIG